MSNEQTLTTTLSTAQAILAAAWGTPVQLAVVDKLASSSRSSIQRFQVKDGPGDAPATVIVKQAVSDAQAEPFNSANNDAFVVQRFYNEWAGLHFLQEVFDGAPPAPRLYGADRATGTLVLEDLGQGSTLVDVVQGNDPTVAATGLIELMTTLGQLHARTIGKAQRYHQLRHALGPSRPYFSSAAEGELAPERIGELFYGIAEALQVAPVASINQDLAAVTHFWAEPGPFNAYTHGDPVPGNEFKVGTQRKLVDFEFGGFHHALTEGVYARIQFVTGFYVQRIPDTVALAMENAYRAELGKGCSEANDDTLFYRTITEACAYATISMWHWAMPGILTADELWGLSSCRQRILRRLEILAETTTTFGHLEALGDMARKLHAELCRRWPAEVHTMPYYPAFRQV